MSVWFEIFVIGIAFYPFVGEEQWIRGNFKEENRPKLKSAVSLDVDECSFVCRPVEHDVIMWFELDQCCLRIVPVESEGSHCHYSGNELYCTILT